MFFPVAAKWYHFKRQNLASIKVDPRTERVKYSQWSLSHTIEMKVTKLFMMISNLKNTFGLLVYIQRFLRFKFQTRWIVLAQHNDCSVCHNARQEVYVNFQVYVNYDNINPIIISY